MPSKPKIAVIGGGTGSFAILSGLKKLDCELTALVNMVDDGGSTGQLRDDYGVLPPGDVRQCLVALSNAPTSLRNLFNFRFPGNGSLGGHSFGNLFLSAVEMMTDNFTESIKMASDILNTQGRVLPVTTKKCQLVMNVDGSKVVGQRAIEVKELHGLRPNLSLSPKASVNPDVKQAIIQADMVVIAPGALYTSIIPALLVQGMSDCLKSTKAKVVYVCNLVNKPNNAFKYKVNDYVSEIERVIGQGIIDYVLYNVDIPSKALLEKYAQDKEYPVVIDSPSLRSVKYSAIPGNFLSHRAEKQDRNDSLLKRSLLRHDGDVVRNAIEDILKDSSRLRYLLI
jgi:uncharacterized cofD-like protein